MLLGPARAVWNHKMLIGALVTAGLIDPNYWKSGSSMGFREGAFGEGSWLRRNLGGRGGMAGAALDWSLDNPGYAAGGAALVGTSLGRSALGLGARGIGAWGAAAAGGATRMVSGVRAGVGHTLRNPNVAAGSWRSGGRTVWGATRGVGGIHGLGSTPARTVGEPALRKLLGGVVGRKAKAAGAAAGSAAIRKGLTVAVAKQIAHLAAARVVTGLAAAATGVGTLATIGLWGWTVWQIGGMIWPIVKDWWVTDKWEQEAKELKEFKNLAYDTETKLKKYGKSVKDPKTGKFLSHEEFEKVGDLNQMMEATGATRVKDDNSLYGYRWYNVDKKGRKTALTEDQQKIYKDFKDIQKYKHAITEGAYGAKVQQRANDRKKLAEKIVAISDGKQFSPNGKTKWNVARLWENYSYQELWDLYYRVVLPRASSDPKINSKATAAVKARLALKKPGAVPVKAAMMYGTGRPEWATAKGQEGMGLEGSAAEWTEKQNWMYAAKMQGMDYHAQQIYAQEKMDAETAAAEVANKPDQVKEFYKESMLGNEAQLMLLEQAKIPHNVYGTMTIDQASADRIGAATAAAMSDDTPKVSEVLEDQVINE